MKAVWNGEVIAESDKTVVIEDNHYFPPDTLTKKFFEDSTHTSFCPWKGTANYLNIRVGDSTNENAAWTYKDPKEEAAQIKDYVAFWKGVEIKD